MTVESSPMDWRSRVDGHAEHVDGDVMVVPTESDQIRGIVIPTVMTFSDVVDLEAVS